MRRVVQVPSDHAAHVGALDDLGQQVLVVQLDQLGGPRHRHRDRRVVQRERVPCGAGFAQLLAQPLQLLGRSSPWW